MNLKELKELFRLVEKTDFTEVEISQGDLRLRIERGKGPTFVAAPNSFQTLSGEGEFVSTTSSRPAPAADQAPKASDQEIVEESGKYQYVTSPFVGTFYRSPSPESEPYTDLGQLIRKGQSLCIVEAMKLMNEIESDFDGKVVEILASNASPVEFGEKLFKIEVSS